MKTAEAEGQKQQGASHDSAPSASQSASPTSHVASPTTASVEGLQLLVQARLSVSSPNDPFEHEAESMADEFVKSIHGRTVSAPTSSAGSVARSVPDSGLVEGGGGGLATTDDTASAIMSARSGGQALSGDVRARFEGFFGADLGGVKIHNDGTSDNLCRSINAEAFTTGSDVFFSSRNFKPGSSSGDHLLAHELTHVVQQGNAPALSRRAMPDIQRMWPFSSDTKEKPKEAEPPGAAKSDGARSKVAMAGLAATGGQVPAAIAEHKLEDSNNLKAAGEAGEAGQSLGLIACTAALFANVIQLLYEWDNESDASSRELLITTVKNGIAAAKQSTTVAQTLGATVIASAIPGLALASDIISLANNCLQIDDFERSIPVYEKETANFKEAELFKQLTIEEKQHYAISTNLLAAAKSRYKGVIVALLADGVSLFSQLTILTGVGASAGGALFAIGAAARGLVLLKSKVAEWSSAEAINESRLELEKAKQALAEHEKNKSGDPIEDQETTDRLKNQVENRTIENLRIDTYAAAREVIKYCASAVKDAGNGDWGIDDEALSLISNFDLDAKWILQYADKPREELLDKGAKIICLKLGIAANPLALKEDVERAAIKAKGSIKYAVRGSGYFVFWSGKQIGHITVDVSEGIQDNVLTPLWNAATEFPGLIWNFFHKADELNKAAGTSAGTFVGGEATSKQTDYFLSGMDLDHRVGGVIGAAVFDYFKSMTKRGETARPEILTRLLKSRYEKFVEIANITHTDGTEPYRSAARQIERINDVISNKIIDWLRPNSFFSQPRVDGDSVSVEDGKVEFNIKDDEKTSAKEVNSEAATEAGKPAQGNDGSWTREAFAWEIHLKARVGKLTRYTIEPYFKEKATRGTDVKPERINELLRSPYRSFVEAANMIHPVVRKPFASAAEQIKLINECMENEILILLPERVDENSLSVKDGKVDFKYKGGGMAKTKGWFADFRGRQAI